MHCYCSFSHCSGKKSSSLPSLIKPRNIRTTGALLSSRAEAAPDLVPRPVTVNHGQQSSRRPDRSGARPAAHPVTRSPDHRSQITGHRSPVTGHQSPQSKKISPVPPNCAPSRDENGWHQPSRMKTNRTGEVAIHVARTRLRPVFGVHFEADPFRTIHGHWVRNTHTSYMEEGQRR